MKSSRILACELAVVLALVLLTLAVGFTYAQTPGPQPKMAPAGTAFTYQGRLRRADAPVTATCQMAFRLYDAATGGAAVGEPLTVSAAVSDSLFNVALDFGAAAFAGDARWLGIHVQCPGDASYTDMGRQALTPAPYALYAQNAPWSGLTGVPAGFADGVDNIGGGQVYTAGVGLILSGTEFSLVESYQLPQSCTNGYIPEWNGANWVCGMDDAGGGGDGWALTGNAGTDPDSNFIGTTDAVTLTLKVSDTAALQLVPGLIAPSLIAGYAGNWVTPGIDGATIAGGGDPGSPNSVSLDYGTVSGGAGNQAYAMATVSGGGDNVAGGHGAVVGGGGFNEALGDAAAIGGGYGNVITETAHRAAIGGGSGNTAGDEYATIGGGSGNTAENNYATVGGGEGNTAGGMNAAIGGGFENTARGYVTTVSGGGNNNAVHNLATIGGGQNNNANGYNATIAGGRDNAADGDNTAIGGGQNNTANADYTTIPGGEGAIADHYGQMAYANGGFGSVDGNAQTSVYVMRRSATMPAGAWFDLYLNGLDSTDLLTIAADSTVVFDILIVGRTEADESVGYQIQCIIENDDGNTQFIGAPILTYLGEDDGAWDARVAVNQTNDALLVQVQGNGEAAIRWVATIRTAEVSW